MNICKTDLILAFQPVSILQFRNAILFTNIVLSRLSLSLSKCFRHHLFLLVLLFMGQAGGTSSVEGGLQRVFISAVN